MQTAVGFPWQQQQRGEILDSVRSPCRQVINSLEQEVPRPREGGARGRLCGSYRPGRALLRAAHPRRPRAVLVGAVLQPVWSGSCRRRRRLAQIGSRFGCGGDGSGSSEAAEPETRGGTLWVQAMPETIQTNRTLQHCPRSETGTWPANSQVTLEPLEPQGTQNVPSWKLMAFPPRPKCSCQCWKEGHSRREETPLDTTV